MGSVARNPAWAAEAVFAQGAEARVRCIAEDAAFNGHSRFTMHKVTMMAKVVESAYT